MGPKTEIYLLPKGLGREASNCKQKGVKTAQRHRRMVWMKKVRKIRWHGAMTETLKTQASNFCFIESSL